MRKIFMLLFGCMSSFAYARHSQQADSIILVLQQSKNDISKVELYQTLFSGYIDDLDEKIKYATEMRLLAEQLNYREGAAAAYSYIGAFYIDKKKFNNTTLRNLYIARDIYEDIGDKHELGAALCKLGEVYTGLRKYELAMDTLLKAKTILEGINDSIYLANTLSSIGCVYYAKREYVEAMDQFLAAMTIYEKCNRKQAMAAIYINMAWISAKQKKYNDANALLKNGLERAKEISYTEGIGEVEKCRKYIDKRQ